MVVQPATVPMVRVRIAIRERAEAGVALRKGETTTKDHKEVVLPLLEEEITLEARQIADPLSSREAMAETTGGEALR